jgi:DNA-binding PadR family transcriptional regulator
VRHAPTPNLAQEQPERPDEAGKTSEAGESNGRRKRRSDTRGGHSPDGHTGSVSKKPSSASRRSQRSDSREKRSEERHSHHRSHGRDRSRAQRGDVRAAILALLADEPMHGYQLMRAIAERTQGAWRPSPGAIYPTIAQLEDEDLVTVIADAGRKLVTLTQSGRDYLETNREAMGDPFTEITSQAGGPADLRGSVEQLSSAARAVSKSGTDAQVAQAQAILTKARRDLYLVLAAEADSPS